MTDAGLKDAIARQYAGRPYADLDQQDQLTVDALVATAAVTHDDLYHFETATGWVDIRDLDPRELEEWRVYCATVGDYDGLAAIADLTGRF